MGTTRNFAYAEVLVLFYDRETGDYEIDAPRAVTNLFGLDRQPLDPD